MRSDKKMYHALFPRTGCVGEGGHDCRLATWLHYKPVFFFWRTIIFFKVKNGDITDEFNKLYYFNLLYNRLI